MRGNLNVKMGTKLFLYTHACKIYYFHEIWIFAPVGCKVSGCLPVVCDKVWNYGHLPAFPCNPLTRDIIFI